MTNNSYHRWSESQILDAINAIREKGYSEPIENDTARHGLLIVAGYDEHKHRSNVEGGETHNLVRHSLNGDTTQILESLLNTDEATLINPEGVIERVSARLKNHIDSRYVARMLGGPQSPEEWEILGFARRVGTRHKNAILASYLMKDTKAYTLSASTGDVRTYYGGRIISSTVPGEVNFFYTQASAA